MQSNHLTIGDHNYRVEINLNTVEQWEKLADKTLSDFENASAQAAMMSKGLATNDIYCWLFCAISEGERIEGRIFSPTIKEFKQEVRPSVLVKFTPIFLSQYMAASSPVDQPKKKRFPKIRTWYSKHLPSTRSKIFFWVLCIGLNLSSIWLGLRLFGVL